MSNNNPESTIITETPKIPLRKFFVGGGMADRNVTELLLQTHKFEKVETAEEAEFILWTGGGDINPNLYGCKPIDDRSGFNDTRDKREVAEFESRKSTQKFLGICRGFQMLNIVHGGQLYQHCNNHTGGDHEVHYVHRDTGERTTFITNTVHHQMIIPASGVRVVGRAEKATYVQYKTAEKQPIRTDALDPEMAWFGPNGYGVQFHPEWGKSSATAFWHGLNDWHEHYHGERLT